MLVSSAPNLLKGRVNALVVVSDDSLLVPSSCGFLALVAIADTLRLRRLPFARGGWVGSAICWALGA